MSFYSDELEKIVVDYSRADLPDLARKFMPDVYRDGQYFLCVRRESGLLISGSGNTIEKALSDWVRSFQKKFPSKDK